jgi:hypothetical protein
MAVDVIRPTKSFYVDERGQFVELTNIDSLVSMVERLTLDARYDFSSASSTLAFQNFYHVK